MERCYANYKSSVCAYMAGKRCILISTNSDLNEQLPKLITLQVQECKSARNTTFYNSKVFTKTLRVKMTSHQQSFRSAVNTAESDKEPRMLPHKSRCDNSCRLHGDALKRGARNKPKSFFPKVRIVIHSINIPQH